MNKIIYFIFGALILFKASFFAFAAEKRVIEREIAVYSIAKKAYFLNDVRRELASLKRFDCLFPDSLLLKGAKLSSKELRGFRPTFSRTIKPSVVYKSTVQKLITISKIATFIDSQASIDFNDYWKTLGPQKCVVSGPKGWSQAFKRMILSEHFLRARFENVPNKKLKSSILKFVDAIDKKINHNEFL